MSNPNFTPDERELLLMQTAVFRDNEAGKGVVLMPSGQFFARCDEPEAKLIVKLFNNVEIVRPVLI